MCNKTCNGVQNQAPAEEKRKETRSRVAKLDTFLRGMEVTRTAEGMPALQQSLPQCDLIENVDKHSSGPLNIST